MRKFLLFLVGIAVFLTADVLAIWALNPDQPTPQAAVRKVGTRLAAHILVKMMKKRTLMPQQLDELLTLEDVRSDGPMVVYDISVKADENEFDMMTPQIEKSLHDTACERDEYKTMLSFGLSVQLFIHTPGGRKTLPLTFTPEGCGIEPL